MRLIAPGAAENQSAAPLRRFRGGATLAVMHRVFALILLVTAYATPPAPAEAQAPAARSPEVCLEAAAPNRPARLQCVGQMSADCVESDDCMASTAGMVMCAESEKRFWQALLDRSAAALDESESSSQRALRQAAIEARAAWLSTRCSYEASLYEGGSLARYLAAACARDVVAEQAIDFYARLHDEP